MRERHNGHYPPCEAPEHAPGCDGLGKTEDHFTPKCIAHLYGWKPKQINSPENLQHLSKACHVEKDRITPAMFEQTRKQIRKNETVVFGAHVGYNTQQTR